MLVFFVIYQSKNDLDKEVYVKLLCLTVLLYYKNTKLVKTVEYNFFGGQSKSWS